MIEKRSNRATDPFLPRVKEHVFAVLEDLDERGLTNHVLVITRWRVLPADIARLEALKHIKLTILITWSGIADPRIEPVRSAHAEASLRALATYAARTKSILYWRPLIAGLNDTDLHLARARALAPLADATVFTGLFHRDEIRKHFRAAGVPDLYDDIPRRKILPREIEARILKLLKVIRSFERRRAASPSPMRSLTSTVTSACLTSATSATSVPRARSGSAHRRTSAPGRM